MTALARRLCSGCGLFTMLALLVLAGPAAAADVAARSLPCAVDGSVRPLRANELCQALRHELGRPLTRVDDARSVRHGEAIQFIHDDVQWVVIWLVDGRIRAWTRVSKVEAAEHQLSFLARAAKALAKTVQAGTEPSCVRLDPNAGHKMRSADLTYPWAELQPCKRQWVEVVDPWWVPSEKPAKS
jgi:hypothetical protein